MCGDVAWMSIAASVWKAESEAAHTAWQRVLISQRWFLDRNSAYSSAVETNVIARSVHVFFRSTAHKRMASFLSSFGPVSADTAVIYVCVMSVFDKTTRSMRLSTNKRSQADPEHWFQSPNVSFGPQTLVLVPKCRSPAPRIVVWDFPGVGGRVPVGRSQVGLEC